VKKKETVNTTAENCYEFIKKQENFLKTSISSRNISERDKLSIVSQKLDKIVLTAKGFVRLIRRNKIKIMSKNNVLASCKTKCNENTNQSILGISNKSNSRTRQ